MANQTTRIAYELATEIHLPTKTSPYSPTGCGKKMAVLTGHKKRTGLGRNKN